MTNFRDLIIKATVEAGFETPEIFALESPPKEEMGDLATNIAIIIAKNNGDNPIKVAEKIITKLSNDDIDNIKIAGGGFVNIYFKKEYYYKILLGILKLGNEYGKNEKGKNKKVLVEYISANPTGPLHIGNARGGPIGEVISNVFSWLGYKVEREFYVNDSGSQIEKFGRTLAYYFLIKKDPNFHFPEDGYPGDFLKQLSEEIQRENIDQIDKLKDGELVNFFIRHGLDLAIRRIKNDLDLLDIRFDRFVYESDFLSSGASKKVVDQLQNSGKTSEKEGAVWFSSPESPEFSDRECVLLRSDAEKTPTYFATDIAYHKDKFDRGHQLLIDIWGPNHHGHIARLKAAMQSLDYDSEKIDILLYQNVKLKQNGEVKQMGKRLGNFINIADLVGEMGVPPDVFKYMVISQNMSSIIDFDLDLALEQSEKNPVFYLQYAYARVCSILRNTDKELLNKVKKIIDGEGDDILGSLSFLKDKKELMLIKALEKLPNILQKIEGDFQIQALPSLATDIAKAYHNFYTSCKVLSEDKELTESRLLLVLATRNVLKITLALMDISAPEKM